MADAACELIGGPYDSRTGHVSFDGEPPKLLKFSLADKDALSRLVLTSIDDDLTAVYVRIEEKPRKVIVYDDNGHARSEKGARYRYSRELSPIERKFEQADFDALLTAQAHEQVMNTRRLLLDEAARREGAR